MKKSDTDLTIRQLKEQLDQLLGEVESADAEDIEESTLKLKQAKELISEIEKMLKFSEVEVDEL